MERWRQDRTWTGRRKHRPPLCEEREILTELDRQTAPPPQGQLRSGLQTAPTPAQCPDVICSVFLVELCVPQSSAVIKQLTARMNLDDGLQNEMNLGASTRVCEYFWGGCVWKGGK